jgi:hypothetical protein
MNQMSNRPRPPAEGRQDARNVLQRGGLEQPVVGIFQQPFETPRNPGNGPRVLQTAAAQCQVPLQLSSIEVGPRAAGREIVCFDVSEYDDPLHTRRIRLPFSAYLKPRRYEWALGMERACTRRLAA